MDLQRCRIKAEKVAKLKTGVKVEVSGVMVTGDKGEEV